MRKGILITVDGPDGCGKSTNSKLLCEYLNSKGYKPLHTHEPGGTVVAEKVRKLLLDPENSISPITELFLYEASRAQHIEEIIRPALGRGRIVICERFCDATTAYQGYGRGLDIKMIKALNRIATNGIKPDLTIILDADVRKSVKKAIAVSKDFKKGVADRLEKEKMSFHVKVRKGFLKIAESEPRRVKVIRVSDTVEATQARVRSSVDKLLGKRI